ncbi:MAG: hypothetical protein AMJ81_14050 [Phycisphaerae bacterium SM23_33]|nr:MAG: hypothetical protein AMJ81_14050 [Phycisphaerae bacterium SM23_33]
MGTKAKSDSLRSIPALLSAMAAMLVWVAAGDGHTLISTERPRGVILSDQEIQSALDDLNSGNLALQLQAAERLALYFGPTLTAGPQTIYRFSHAPTQQAYEAMHKARPIPLLLACLKQEAPLLRTWAICRLRAQIYMSDTKEQQEKTIRSLLAVDGLVSASNRQEITDAIRLSLKDPDAGARAEALSTLIALGYHDAYGQSRHALDDTAPGVRARAWGLLARTEKRNHPPDDFVREHLLRDLANENDQLAAAALGYVSNAGSRVAMGLRLQENVKPWKRILDAAEGQVLNALQHRPAVQVQAIFACWYYPRSEPLLIQLLPSESLQFYVVSALMAVGTQPSIDALRKLQPDVSAQTQPSRVDAAIKIIEERLARQPKP